MNVHKLLRQAQEVQEKMAKEQSNTVVETAVGGGMVKVKIDGHKNLVAVKIDPEALDPNDVGMLEDLILAAVNEAHRKMDDTLRERFGSMAGDLSKLL